MGKFKNRLQRFFYGRYGYDTLGKTLLWVYVGILLIYTVIALFVPDPLLYVLYLLLSTALFVYIIFRVMSRNIEKRRRENERFCRFFKMRRNRFRDRKTHVYRTCPRCHATLRLPKAKGVHTVVCPRCRERFEVKGK